MTEYKLSFDKNGDPAPKDLIVLTTLILMRGASLDGLTAEELSHISEIISWNFNWKQEEIGDAVSMSQIILKDSDQINKLIVELNNSYNIQQRQKLLSLVWRVILSDKSLSENEASYSIELRKLLHLSLEQSAYARSQAEQKN